MSIDLILSKLDKVKGGSGKWTSCCPAHEDKSPSMSIKELPDGKVLLYCFAGCSVQSIVASIGLRMRDLNPNLSDDDINRYKAKYSAQEIERAGSSPPIDFTVQGKGHLSQDTCSFI